MENLEVRINNVLEKIRPYLQEDKGDIEFVRYEEETQTAEFRFLGNCVGCPLMMMTFRGGVERFIVRYVPEVRRIELVK